MHNPPNKPGSGLLGCPVELLPPIFSQVLALDLIQYQHPAQPIRILTDSHHSPLDHPIAVTNKHMREVMARWYYGTFLFTYKSAVEGSHQTYGASGGSHPRRDLTAIDDLDQFFGGVIDLSMMRKLDLQMHASELLMLFAPAECATLLSLPAPEARGKWTQVRKSLQGCRGLQSLTIGLIERTCPSTCQRAGDLQGGRRSGRSCSVPVHFQVDHRWIVKSVVETMGNFLPRRNIQFKLANGEQLKARDTEEIAGCSWNMLHSDCGARHCCDALMTKELTGGDRWAAPGDGKMSYEIPVKAAGVGGVEDELAKAEDDGAWELGTLFE